MNNLFPKYILKYNICNLIVIFISLENDKFIALWKALFNFTAKQLRWFSSIILSNQICFSLAMPTKS